MNRRELIKQYGERYYLQNDPNEFTNVWNDPHHKDTPEVMMLTPASRMIDASDPVPQKSAPW
jgi:hypothetical protein